MTNSINIGGEKICDKFTLKKMFPFGENFFKQIHLFLPLKKFDKFSLDDSTGSHSVFTKFSEMDIMFHVCPLLPYSAKDLQQVER